MISALRRLNLTAQEDNPLWLVVLADMMTNLMLFFLVMYAMTIQGPTAQREMARAFDAQAVIDPKPQPVAAEADFKEKEAAKRLKEIFGDVDVTQRLIRVRLQDRLLFGSGDADLAVAAGDPLAKLAAVLGDMPNPVVVEGHTDDIRLGHMAYKSNWELSVARSYSVIERLVAAGVAPARLVASGYGEHRPIAGNDSAEGRARNRRVEILILRGEKRDE